MSITTTRGQCAACMCEGKRAPADWSFCSGLVFGRMGAGLTLCERHDAMVQSFRSDLGHSAPGGVKRP